jgi:hypothetical protein
MTYSVEYRSKRSEVLAALWSAWKRGLWRGHAFLFLAISGGGILATYQSVGFPGALLVPVLIGAAVSLMLLPGYPMLAFKPQLRRLKIDETGVHTTVGKRSGSRTWAEIRSADLENGAVVMTVRTGNKFIVPARAFAGESEQLKFLDYARQQVGATAS